MSNKIKLGREQGPGRNTSLLSQEAPGIYGVVSRNLQSLTNVMYMEFPRVAQEEDNPRPVAAEPASNEMGARIYQFPRQEQVSQQIGQVGVGMSATPPRADYSNVVQFPRNHQEYASPQTDTANTGEQTSNVVQFPGAYQEYTPDEQRHNNYINSITQPAQPAPTVSQIAEQATANTAALQEPPRSGYVPGVNRETA